MITLLTYAASSGFRGAGLRSGTPAAVADRGDKIAGRSYEHPMERLVPKKSVASASAAYHHGDLRSALIAEGRKMLEEVGVHDLSLRQLARAVGVSEAAPSRHFAGKPDLLASIAASGFRDLSALRRTALAKCARASDRAYAMMRIYVRFAQDHKGLFDLMIGPRILRKADHHELAQATVESFQLFESSVCDYAREHGWPEERMNLVTHAAWAMEHGLATLIIGDRVDADDRPVNVEAMVHVAVALLLGGIAAGPAHLAEVEKALAEAPGAPKPSRRRAT